MHTRCQRFIGLALCAIGILGTVTWAQEAAPAHPVRNDVPREGTELLVLRHQRLIKGGHEGYFRLSRDGVWPWYEKIGSRIVGQWKVIHPDASGKEQQFDSGYRLARYASYAHWKETRQGHLLLGGDGPDYRRNREALRARTHYTAGSDGAHFLEGVTAATRPYHMPALEESYEVVASASDSDALPVRNDVNWPAPEIVALDRWQVNKGTGEAFLRTGVERIWPYLEKVGARVVGQWKAVYPPESGFPESSEYDEVFMLVRFAGYEHWKAARPQRIAELGGNGRDYEAYRSALEDQEAVTRSHSVAFLEGHLYQSPPKFLPGLREHYRKTN